MENIIRNAIQEFGLNNLTGGVYTNLDGYLRDNYGNIMPRNLEARIRGEHNLSKNEPIYAIFSVVKETEGDFWTAKRTYHISSCILDAGITFRFITHTEGWDKDEDTSFGIPFSAIEKITIEKLDLNSDENNPNAYYFSPLAWDDYCLRFYDLEDCSYSNVPCCYFAHYDISGALDYILECREHSFQQDSEYYENLYNEFDRLENEEKYQELFDLTQEVSEQIPPHIYYYNIIKALICLERDEEAFDYYNSFKEYFQQYSEEEEDYNEVARYFYYIEAFGFQFCGNYNDAYWAALNYQYLNEISDGDYSNDKIECYNRYIENFNEIDPKDRRIITTSKTTQLFRSDHITLLNIDILPDITFPTTHPKLDHTYICHPYKTDTYLPIEDYDNELLYDRMSEFCYLLECLGATSTSTENIKGESSDASSHANIQCNAEGKYKIISANASTEFDGRKKNFSQSTLKIGRNQHFNPTKKPFVPENLVWFPHQIAWQRLVQQRMNGNLLNHSEYLSSSEQKIISNSEMVKINGELDALFASIKGGVEFNRERNIENNKEVEWRVNVTFKPMEEFNDDSYRYSAALPVNEPLQIEESITDDKEQQYMEEVRFMLDDNGVIDERERMMLDRMINVLGISPERAQQLEMLVSSENGLTKEEKEYLEKYKVFIENGEVSDRERQMLIRFANLLGISEERALELERQA